MLCFHWRLRRLFVWHISLADVILSKHGLSEWAVDQLNSSKHVRGPTFFVDANGAIAARRRLKYPLGHFEEIGRQCFRYRADARHLADRNQIAMWMLNYRREDDLRLYPSDLPPLA